MQNAIQSALNAAPCPNAFQDRLCFDSFVTTFDPTGKLIFSTYQGGKFGEMTGSSATSPDGSIYLTGYTESFDYPVTAGAVQPTAKSGTDFLLAHIDLKVQETAPNPTAGSEKSYLPLLNR